MRDVSGYIVTPGLIDLHTHVYWGGTSLGIDADEFCRTSGVTTSVDTGWAGPGNLAGFRKHVIEPSQARILAYLHVSHAGIYGFYDRVMVGESGDLRLMNPIDAVEVADANRDLIVGIKVRVGLHASGNSGIVPLNIALQVANEVGMPLMCHIDHPPPSYEEVVGMLRPGDVLTHAFRPFPNAPATRAGHGEAGGAGGPQARRHLRHRPRQGLVRLQDDARHARQRLRAGHDLVGRAQLCIDGPAFDQVTTMSKFLCMGMSLNNVIAASTVNAAMALKRPEIRLAQGRLARRRDDPDGQGRQVRLCRRRRRAHDGDRKIGARASCSTGAGGTPRTASRRSAGRRRHEPRLSLDLAARGLCGRVRRRHQRGAQDYPTRQIVLVVPYAAGGGNDAMARIVADKMGKTLGQQIVIENRGGAGGSIATRAGGQGRA